MSETNTSPPCRCTNRPPSAMRTVVKEGPNKGRQFYTCSKSSCKFFEWVNTATRIPSASSNNVVNNNTKTISSVSTNNYNQSSSFSPIKSSSSSSNNQSVPSINSNNLNIPSCSKHPTIKCKLLQVSKEGSNRGKLFWSCGSSNQKEKCNHFKWFEGDVDQYKHLVPHYNAGAQPSPKKPSALQQEEPVAPIFMSSKNSQNNWVAGLPVETFYEISKYMQLSPDFLKIQRVCVEWKRMSDVIIGNMMRDNIVELNLGFLKEDTSFSDLCEIFKKFHQVKQVTFCNFTIYGELMRLLEWVGVETLVFYNCKTKMSCDQHETVKEHVPSLHDYDHIDWAYVQANRGSLFSKRDRETFKTKFAFRRHVTQMLFSGLEEDKEVLIADLNPEHIDDILQFATMDCYKKFVNYIKQKHGLVNHFPGRRFENLKRIISIDSRELNFSWVNKDRGVYYRVLDRDCANKDIRKFFEETEVKPIVPDEKKENDDTNLLPTTTTIGTLGWYYKTFLVSDRAISVISLPFTQNRGDVQIYNGVSCKYKTVVQPTPNLGIKCLLDVLTKFNIIHYVDKRIFDPKSYAGVERGIGLGVLSLTDTFLHKTIMEIYLGPALSSSRKMVSADLDELKKFCYKNPIQKAIKLLLFLHKQTDLMKRYEIPPKVHHLIRSIDSIWFHQEEFIDNEDDNPPSLSSLTTLITVGEEPIKVPFSWYHFVKTGEIKHIYELTPDQRGIPDEDSVIQEEEPQEENDVEEEDDDDEEDDEKAPLELNNINYNSDEDSDVSSEGGNEPEVDEDYNEEEEPEPEDDEEEDDEEDEDYESDSTKKRRKRTKPSRSKKRKH